MREAKCMGGICPTCKKKALVEARVRRAGAKSLLDERGGWWKTKCSACGEWIGYRPYKPGE